MKKLILLVAIVSLLLPSCTAPPPVTGTFATKDGQVIVHPSGHFEIIVEPRTAK